MTLKAQIDGLQRESMGARIGQICAFLIGITTIISGTYAAVHGAEISGALIGTGGVIGLVTVFIYGRKGNPKQEQVQAAEVKDLDVKDKT
jgi:uncharacterized membrane protein